MTILSPYGRGVHAAWRYQSLAHELKNSLGTPPLGISGSEREGCRTVSQHSKKTYDHDDGRSTMVTHNSRWGRKEKNAAICTLDL